MYNSGGGRQTEWENLSWRRVNEQYVSRACVCKLDYIQVRMSVSAPSICMLE